MTDTINDVMAGAFSTEEPCANGEGRWGHERFNRCEVCNRVFCDECFAEHRTLIDSPCREDSDE